MAQRLQITSVRCGHRLASLEHAQGAAGQIYNCGDERQISARQWVKMIAAELGHRWEIVSVPDAVPHAGRLHAGADEPAMRRR
jgi:nucleoside-diphosphate-sugar epimerase